MLTLFFVRSASDARPMANETIAIWPIEPGWNDFGYGFQAVVQVRTKSRPDLNLRLFVVPWRDALLANRFNTWVEQHLGDRNVTDLIDEVGNSFYSVLRGDGYKRLMEWCTGDGDLRDEILLSLRDIVFFRWRDIESNSIRLLLQDQSVAIGVFRDESAFLAVHRAWRTLAGLGASQIEDAKQDFDFACHLMGYRSHHECSFSFDVPLPLTSRCHALIGRNGVGKSRLLQTLVLYLGVANDNGNYPFTDGPPPLPPDIRTNLSPRAFNRVLVMTWDNNSDYPPASRLDAPFEYLRFKMTGGSEVADASKVPVDESDYMTSMLVQILRDRESGTDRFAVLKRVLEPLLDIDFLAVRLRPEPNDMTGEGQWIWLGQVHANGEQARLERLSRVDPFSPPVRMHEKRPVSLSSGERSFLGFAIRIVASLVPGSLLILDEPETHLHPNLIADLMQVLQPILAETKSIAIVATHSPYVVRELPSACVHMVQVDSDGRPSVRHAYLRTLGASIDRLSIDIFGDALQSKHHMRLARKIASECGTVDEVLTRYGDEVSSEMLSLVREFLEGARAAT